MTKSKLDERRAGTEKAASVAPMRLKIDNRHRQGPHTNTSEHHRHLSSQFSSSHLAQLPLRELNSLVLLYRVMCLHHGSRHPDPLTSAAFSAVTVCCRNLPPLLSHIQVPQEPPFSHFSASDYHKLEGIIAMTCLTATFKLLVRKTVKPPCHQPGSGWVVVKLGLTATDTSNGRGSSCLNYLPA